MSDNPKIFDHKTDWAALILRLVFGGMMFFQHGLPKMMKLFGSSQVEFFSFLGLSPRLSLALTVFAEAICALLVVIGLVTRLASIPLIITMLVAILMVHWGDPIGKIEMAILYLGAYLAILHLGGGKFSLDHRISKV